LSLHVFIVAFKIPFSMLIHTVELEKTGDNLDRT